MSVYWQTVNLQVCQYSFLKIFGEEYKPKMGTVTPANHTEPERYWQGKLHAKTNEKHGNKEVW